MLIILGSIFFLLSHIVSVTFYINDQIQKKRIFAFNVSQAINALDFTLSPYDITHPAGNNWLLFSPAIRINQAITYTLYTDINQDPLTVISTERRPANLYAAINVPIFPGDRILLNGKEIDLSEKVAYQPYHTLQLIKSTTIELDQGQETIQYSSSQPNVGLALLEKGILIRAKDYIGFPLQTNLSEIEKLGYYPASPYTIEIDGKTIQIMAAAKTTGAALANAGFSLHGLDYSIPSADQPLPASGKISVIRVNEEIYIKQTKIPYESTFVANPEVELDQREITQAGQYGLLAARERIRYENGVEVARNTEEEWTAAEPVNQEISYGQKVVIRTVSTPQGELEYWRSVSVYATAYSPCRSAADRCYFGTSFGLPVKQGVIGVTRAWYYDMAGQSVYVPGYGAAVIADIGAGIAGKHWIDLGYTDEEFEQYAIGVWPQTVTLYFLTPVPEVIPWILP
ncbi:MAG: G5 domain-containing protein [Anaerolineaceae bacterium]|nr:G5 domain-containing protein [Anaerolineaceae bacterium]